jgi:hypothetical protein
MCSSTVRFNYRLRVSPQAESRLRAEWDNARWVWKRCVEESKTTFRASTPGSKITCGPAKLCKDLTRWRSENEWLKNASAVVQQQTIRDFGRARSKALKDIKDRCQSANAGGNRGSSRVTTRHRRLTTSRPDSLFTKTRNPTTRSTTSKWRVDKVSCVCTWREASSSARSGHARCSRRRRRSAHIPRRRRRLVGELRCGGRTRVASCERTRDWR